LCDEQEATHFRSNVELKRYDDLDARNKLLEIAFSNLVENSLIYRKKEELEILLDIREGEDRLSINFSDNGLGIPHEYHNKVYDMYFRGSVISDGNGLGLYVVKKAIDALKGEIKLLSEPLEFTKFEISFKI
jgi:K+-sensing histidine kinase KdpD